MLSFIKFITYEEIASHAIHPKLRIKMAAKKVEETVEETPVVEETVEE